MLGVDASALVGRVVPLEEMWSHATARRLLDRLPDARDMAAAAALLKSAIAERLAVAERPMPRAQLAMDAADRLASATSVGCSKRRWA